MNLAQHFRVLTIGLALCGLPNVLQGQLGGVSGAVRDSVTSEPIEGVRVELLINGNTVARAMTDGAGRFAISDVRPGRYRLVLTRIDYRQKRLETVAITAGRQLFIPTIVMSPIAFEINPLVVSASRREQKMLDAPASVSVIDRRAIEERPALTPIDHIFGVTGIDVATTGLVQHEVVARGFNNVSSGALLVLTDNRYASIPSLRINVYNFIPTSNDDIERIELVRGPGAALYGPNSAGGVMHIVTRSPFESEGTVLSVAGGEQSLFTATLRHASVLGREHRIGFKISGQYLRGTDWQFTDPVEQSNRIVAVVGGADPDTLLIGLRDPSVERVSGDVRIDWRPGSDTRLDVSAGLNHAQRNVEVTSVGASQVRDWRYGYAQARFGRGRLFAQAFINLSDAGDTYLLRTGAPIRDNSRMLVAQVQHGIAIGDRSSVTYGLDLQRTEPRTEGTITGRNEADDIIDEAGIYLHSETIVSSSWRLIAAARADYHNRLSDPVFSPRAAIVYQPTANHTLRFSYNRAFAPPTTNNLFLDLLADSLRPPLGPALPFAIRVSGVPETGFTFRRDCNGLCMRSPFTPSSLGGPGAYMPVDGTLLWDNILDTLAARGLDLVGIPAPSANQVGTNVFLVDGLTGALNPIDTVVDILPLKAAITNVFEVGYRGIISRRFLISVDMYYMRKNDFVGPLRIETPSAFLDSASLANYLTGFMPQDTARFIATLASRLPVGTISPEEALDQWDLIITYRNFGDITLWGADVELGAVLMPTLSVRGTYSWVSEDIFENLSGIADVALNSPRNKGSFTVDYRNDRIGLAANMRGRVVSGFPVNSGVYTGDVESYAVLDAQVGYRLSSTPNVTVTLSVQNVLDNRHAEFVGTPEIGRLLLGRVRAEF